MFKNTSYKWNSMDSEMIDAAPCETCNKVSLDVEYVISVSYCHSTAKTRAIYECTDGPARQRAEKPPNPDGLGELHRTVPRLTLEV